MAHAQCRSCPAATLRGTYPKWEMTFLAMGRTILARWEGARYG